jgi:hypothetical protein
MDIDEVKRFIRENQRGLIVGFAAGFLLRSLMR